MADSSEYLGLTPLQTAMLASVSHDDKTSVLDSDNHFIIDSITKTISSQGGKKEFGRGAHNSDVITFECDRYIEGHDMTLCNVIRIHYLNGNNPGTYDVNDMAVKSDDDTKATFTWTITSNVTASLGKIRFAIAFKCVQEDDSVSYCMPTKINEELSVFDTIDNSETVVQENFDILEQWKQDLFDASEREIGEAVAAYLTENPPSGATDEQAEQIQKNANDIGELKSDLSQLSEEIANLTGADPEVISQAVSDWLDAHPEVTTTVGDGTITEAKLDEELKKKIDSGGIDIVYPTQLTTYNSKLTEYLQKLADNSDTINTSNENMAHSVLVSSVGRTVVFAFVENDTSGAKEDDCSSSTDVHCKGRILIDRAPAGNVYQNNFIGDSGIFYLFENGETVYDADGGTVGTVVASTGAIVTSVDENNYHINSRVRLNDGRVIHAHRLLTVSYTVTNSRNTITVSHELGEIKNTTLTVAGVTGDNDLSRVSGDYSGIVYSGCGFQYNVDDGKAYTASVISGKGVAICSTTDFIDFQFMAFYEFSNAYIEASLFFDVAYIDNTAYNRKCVYVACRQPYGVNYTRIAKLDYVNNYEVLDEIDVPSATSRPMWSSSRYVGRSYSDYNCFLLLGDYNRDYMSIYKIVDRDIRNLKPVAKIKGKCSNYPAIAERRNSVTTASYGDVIIAGTNGNHTNFGGISFIACKLADGLEDFSDSEPYTKDEIDAMFGSYVSDVALLVGGDA